MRQPGFSQRHDLARVLSVARYWFAVVAAVSVVATLTPASAAQSEDDPGHQVDGTVSTESSSPQAGEEPPSDTGEESSDDLEPTEENLELPTLATLIFTADAPCSLFVNGVATAALEPGEPISVDVTTLSSSVLAASTELISARWTEELELELDETREIAIPMLEAIENERKTERRTLVFRDLDRGWMWTRRDGARDLAWSNAVDYCEALELGGFDDWELPSLAELESLEAIWSIRPLKVADQVLLTACCVWSSTEGADGTVWNMDFRFRREFEANPSLSFGLRALCVREMPAEELAEAKLAADPKERKRRLKEKRRRQEEVKRRKAERAAAKAAKKLEEG